MSPFGFLNCNKPAGITSRDAVNIVQRRLRKVKVGHAGTLDPLATGVLVIGVGPASRLVPYVQQQAKHYQATFRFGASSISGDLEGEITAHPELPEPSLAEVESAAKNLVGEIEQTPPAHSAIWVDGQRAYKRIRAGEDFEMPTRIVEVYALEILRYEYPEIDLNIVCGSGTYIRSLGIDLARACGTRAVMTDLCRHAIGQFAIENAFSVEQLRSENLQSMMSNPVMAVQHLDHISVDDIQSRRLGHGLSLQTSKPTAQQTEAVAVTVGGKLLAIIREKHGDWFPYRVFPAE